VLAGTLLLCVFRSYSSLGWSHKMLLPADMFNTVWNLYIYQNNIYPPSFYFHKEMLWFTCEKCKFHKCSKSETRTLSRTLTRLCIFISMVHIVYQNHSWVALPYELPEDWIMSFLIRAARGHIGSRFHWFKSHFIPLHFSPSLPLRPLYSSPSLSAGFIYCRSSGVVQSHYPRICTFLNNQ